MMLAGFESPTAGDILLDGKPITRMPPHKRNIGMVFQNYALFPHLTVGAERRLSADGAQASPKAEQRAAGRAARSTMVRLDGMAERRPAQLSGGQQQRVALARALVFEPQLVLMDEPLGALDKQLREHMQIELKELHRQLGVTFVYVTHDQGEALTMSRPRRRVQRRRDPAARRRRPHVRGAGEPLRRRLHRRQHDAARHGRARSTTRERCGIVLTDGRVLTGLNVNGARVGAAVEACIRPERIVLHRQAPRRARQRAAGAASPASSTSATTCGCSAASARARTTATVKLPLGDAGTRAAARRRRLARISRPSCTRVYRLTRRHRASIRHRCHSTGDLT